ncbi:MAG: hypothetical protein A2X05_04810 [Bacteroidetes bacterium GWE2_41_25]|nr:MAG: hypothetical protein A2X03_11360 [Bacteroidetes bacterium GWA2_40_15]OFX84069.1 MAG: hypothetical protein A2X06_14465 [Bacteroidetes bacterium GWC2_40_22]OFX94232.1 MAG: hypothetical protein A2X05_04810 [Bacteroidetes bacterium GWE2_41_25]OFY59058.1 MAG: hypothetical protein A2X04_08245 [Bacteroidetes bacterium GWF2_41_9]
MSTSNSCTKDAADDTPGPGGKPNVTVPGANEVWIQGTSFTPETITVIAGTTITWTNKDGIIHTVTSSTELFDSGNIASNGTYSFKFNTAGSFPYFCKVHPTMTAKVVVN